MANLPYSFKGKPMEPYDKKHGAERGPLLVVGALVAVLLLVIGGILLWLAFRQHPAKALHSDEESNPRTVVELPSSKDQDAPAPVQAKVPAAQPAKPLPPPQPPKQLNPQEAAKRLDAASKLFADEKYALCRDECWKALDLVNETDPLWSKGTDLLGKASMVIFTTDVRAPEKILHHVKGGDSLLKLAIANDTTMEAIRKSSGMAPDDNVIRPGQSLSIYKGVWSIKVSKSRYRLYVYDGGRLFKVYAVGIGRQDRTPAGTFELGVKQRNPDWYNKGRKYEYGSPENILGTRWMALNPTGSTSQDLMGYGIHGTNDPANVGKSTSNGCVRMRNDDVDELFAITPMKTPVEIVE